MPANDNFISIRLQSDGFYVFLSEEDPHCPVSVRTSDISLYVNRLKEYLTDCGKSEIVVCSTPQNNHNIQVIPRAFADAEGNGRGNMETGRFVTFRDYVSLDDVYILYDIPSPIADVLNKSSVRHAMASLFLAEPDYINVLVEQGILMAVVRQNGRLL